MKLNANINLLFIQLFCLRLYSDANGSPDREKQDHVSRILLKPDPYGFSDDHPLVRKVIGNLIKVYRQQIRPVERLTRFGYLYQSAVTDADISANPLVLVVGPWSTGKTTLINHLLGIEHQPFKLYIGAEPTTADFVVLTNGQQYRPVDGSILTTSKEKLFKDLRRLGPMDSLKRVVNIQIPSPLLRNLTFVDTPGILEHSRLRERGYPFDNIMRWFVDKAQLVVIVFDPTKLDVGREMDSLSEWLRGKQSLVRIVLNKADSVTETQLMRLYGALFWTLSPLFNLTGAPRVFVSSFKSGRYGDDELEHLFEQEEQHLLDDIYDTILSRIPAKVARLRSHAIKVRAHALLIDGYARAYRQKSRWFSNDKNADLAEDIINYPDRYEIYDKLPAEVQPILNGLNTLPLRSVYKDFLKRNPLERQDPISSYREGIFGSKGDLLKRINRAIDVDLPQILHQYQKSVADQKLKMAPSTLSETIKLTDRKKSAFREHFESIQPKYPSRGFEESSSQEEPENLDLGKRAQDYVNDINEFLPAKKLEQVGSKEAEISAETKRELNHKKEELIATKCPKYRKTCKDVIPPKSEAAKIEKPLKKKCLLYRKSCETESQKNGTKTVGNKTAATIAINDTVKETTEVSKPHIETVKCPIYRKTCSVSLRVETPLKSTKLDERPEKSPVHKCVKYRKSCKIMQDSRERTAQAPRLLFDLDNQMQKVIKKGEKKLLVENQMSKIKVIKQSEAAKESELEDSIPSAEEKFESAQQEEKIVDLEEPQTIKHERHPKRKKYEQHVEKEILKVAKRTPFFSGENIGYVTDDNLEYLESSEEVEDEDSSPTSEVISKQNEVIYEEDKAIAQEEELKKDTETKSDLANCPRYRKSCKHVESKVQAVKIVPSIATNKCILYRVSCKNGTFKTASSTIDHIILGRDADEVVSRKIASKFISAKKGEGVEEVEEFVSTEMPLWSAKKEKRQRENEEKRKLASVRCIIYRKSCTPTENDRKHSVAFVDLIDFVKNFAFIQKLFDQSKSRLDEKVVKCPIYRKSCLYNDEKYVEKQAIPLVETKKQSHAKKSTEKAPPPKEEKDVKPVDRSEEAVLEKTTPAEREKCLLYRKSCTIIPTEKQVISLAKLDKLSLQQQTLNEQKIMEKCPKYRKSCGVMTNVPKKSPKSTSITSNMAKLKNGQKAEKSAEPSSVPCPVYRKSCAPDILKPSSKVKLKHKEDVVYILDQETGKMKKYCKKKSAITADSRGGKKLKDMPIIERIVRYLCS